MSYLRPRQRKKRRRCSCREERLHRTAAFFDRTKGLSKRIILDVQISKGLSKVFDYLRYYETSSARYADGATARATRKFMGETRKEINAKAFSASSFADLDSLIWIGRLIVLVVVWLWLVVELQFIGCIRHVRCNGCSINEHGATDSYSIFCLLLHCYFLILITIPPVTPVYYEAIILLRTNFVSVFHRLYRWHQEPSNQVRVTSC